MILLEFQKKLQGAAGIMFLDIALELPKGSFTSICGKSGAGKTTLLRTIAGLEKVSHGKIIVNNTTWLDTSKRIYLQPQKRNIGIVFQDYSLFPHMTVRENLAFALSKNQDPKTIDELIAITELGDLQKQKPNLLSGGQQQRVALAMALIQKPEVLLLDEPLSALDPEMRQKLQLLIKELHTTYELTTLMVSHDQEEILLLSDNVVTLDKGLITKQEAPYQRSKSTTSFSSNYQLKGKIIALESNGTVLIVMIGQNILKIPNTKKESTTPSIGDEIVLSFKNSNLEILL